MRVLRRQGGTEMGELKGLAETGREKLAAIALSLALGGLAAGPALAAAAPDRLGSGTASIALTAPFRALLKKDGVKVTASAPASFNGKALSLPVAGGEMDPTVGQGKVLLAGAVKLKAGHRSVLLTDFMVRTEKTPLIAKVGGGQLKIATAAKISTRREGFGTDFSARSLGLTKKVAMRLNSRLRPRHPFSVGETFGKLALESQPETVTILERNQATLVFDAAFLAKLNERHVSINPIFPAEHQGASFSFPIIPGGSLAPDASKGTLRSGGDVEFLQLGGGQIFWHELYAELGPRAETAEQNIQPSPPYPGKQGRLALIRLNTQGATLSSNPQARTIGLSGVVLTFEPAGASAFNEAFTFSEGEAFKVGETVGVLSFTAQGQ
jgi:hypothetical protein